MLFTKRLHEAIKRGDVTCSVRIWLRPRVKVGGRYRLDAGGAVEVDAIEPISIAHVTPELARRSGFLGVVDLLKVAKHGRGDRVFLIHFHYVPDRRPRPRRHTAG